MTLSFRQPNSYSECCGCDEKPINVSTKRARPAPCPEPEPVQQCDGSFKTDCHCLLQGFLKRYKQFECRGEDVICCALEDAELCVAGFLRGPRRDKALMLIAAHEMEVQAVQVTESTSRVASASKGSPLARPSGPGNAPNDEAYYALSAYGLAYWEMLETIPRTGILALG